MSMFARVRPSDVVLTAVLVAVAVYIGVENVIAPAGATVAHPLDTHTPLMIPVFAAAALPILWRRRNILAAIGVSIVIVGASVLAFGWVTRCGFALPLSIAMAYAVARFAGNWQRQLAGVVGIVALQVVVLVRDASTGGLDALPYSLPAAALLYGIGHLVRSRTAKRVITPTVSVERVHA